MPHGVWRQNGFGVKNMDPNQSAGARSQLIHTLAVQRKQAPKAPCACFLSHKEGIKQHPSQRVVVGDSAQFLAHSKQLKSAT